MPFQKLFSSPHCAVASTFPLRGGQLRVKELRCTRKAPTTASTSGLAAWAVPGRSACPALAQRARFVRRIWFGGQQLPAFCGNVCQTKLGVEPKAVSLFCTPEETCLLLFLGPMPRAKGLNLDYPESCARGSALLRALDLQYPRDVYPCLQEDSLNRFEL